MRIQWSSTDLGEIKDNSINGLASLQCFKFIQTFERSIAGFYIILITLAEFYARKYISMNLVDNTKAEDILNRSPSIFILCAAVTAILFLIFITFRLKVGNRNKKIDKNLLYHRVSFWELIHESIIYRALPRDIGVLFSAGWGSVGMLVTLLSLFLMKNSLLIDKLNVILIVSFFFYALMEVMHILFNRFSLVSLFLLYIAIIFSKNILNIFYSTPKEIEVLFWFPLAILMILPFIQGVFTPKN
jgi:hypothetical protein